MTPLTLKAADALEGAAQNIKRHGHAKYILVDAEGHLCSIGAITMAVTGRAYPAPVPDSVAQSIYTAAVNAFSFSVGAPVTPAAQAGIGICLWNNQAERTAEQVIAKMRATASALRKGELV